MSEVTGRFRRSDRLLNSRDFRRVSRKGRRFAGSGFVMLIAPAGPGAGAECRRLGITAARRVGNAVVRNRLKRGMREWFRARRHLMPEGIDIVVIARQEAAKLDGRGIAESLDELSQQAFEVWKARRSNG